MSTTGDLLSRAFAFQASGKFADAERLYRDVLQTDAHCAQAWNGLGAACHEQGRPDQAADCLEQAIRLVPTMVDARHRLGVVLAQSGRLDDAVGQMQEALRLQPANHEIANNLRITLAARERKLALIDSGAKLLPQAEMHCRRALELTPDDPAVLTLLAQSVADQDRGEEAIALFAEVTRIRPNLVQAHFNLGIANLRAKHNEQAETNFRRAIELSRSMAEAHNGLGVALVMQNRWSEAEACYRRALDLNGEYTDATYNLARALVGQDRFSEAIGWLERTLELKNDHVEASYSMALTLMELNRVEDAADWYARTIGLKHDYADAHVGRSIALFLAGRYAEAWGEYEWRFLATPLAGPPEELRWRGAPLAGRTVLLRAEQGAGDALHFIRYAPMVKRLGARVLVWCAPGLGRLLATAPGVDGVYLDGQPWPAFDVHASLLSLPGIFGTTLDNVPADAPYLEADPVLVEQWRAELADEPSLKIGIAWRGSPTHPRNRFRSFGIEQLAPIAQVPGVRLYSLQFGAGGNELEILNGALPPGNRPVVDFSERLGDFYNTAAIVRNLDLVITCDSAPAHLAGALGVPVWVALPFAPDWRWLLGRSDTPWYPTMQLFRPSRLGDWPGIFSAMRDALLERVRAQ